MMTKKSLTLWLISLVLLAASCTDTPTLTDIPRLQDRDGMKKLIVDGRPFICVGGEVSNTASSDSVTMKRTIGRLAEANLNTILTVVSWDLFEPVEGKFDFSWIDYQIEAARENDVRLILLWFASWKNGLSHFVPEWVKADQERFPRVVNADGNTLEILSTLSTANRDADARAFAAFMKHIREVDSKEHTVIAIQVQNEPGLLGSTRDFCDAANKAFSGPVPEELIDYLVENEENLLPELKKIWQVAGSKTSGTWEEVFGKNVPRPADNPPVPNSPDRQLRPADAELLTHTDEIFMAWNYSQYIGYIAAQGKKEYPLPMFVNTWIVQPNDLGPGDYPSGGPEPLVHDIWRAGAPAIDILAPDIYLPQYEEIIRAFARNGNPAFNPETRMDANLCWKAFTELDVLCYSPFGIDNLDPQGSFARAYGFIGDLSGAIAEAQGRKDAIRLIIPEPGEHPGRVEMGGYIFDFAVSPVRRGIAVTGPSPSADTAAIRSGRGSSLTLSFLEDPFVLIINTDPNEYYFATNSNYSFRVSPASGGGIAAPASIDQGAFVNGKWMMSRRLNGDDLMRGGYDLSGAAANNQAGTLIPLRRGRGFSPGEAGQPVPPTVTKIRFYRYN
ncbi:MAG TPA: beta-galactosidase [Bacteroidales bacterium]|nr:beta-galactosidase [Bacteroidales bacterium]HPR12991.1 beta-galactosidase [Bacteroidales bacterium]